MKPRLQIITVSTRPGRVGPSVSAWFTEFARQHGKFDASEVDLAEFKLPVYDEPNHPTLQQYTQEHTKAWAASVTAGDAYVFVVPEYNYNPPSTFYNALNYVYREWNYKPCGFVSYGGASGGLRAAQMAKQLVTTLKMMPMVEGVMVPMVGTMLDENKRFRSNELIDKSGVAMLDELFKWAEALKPMRG